MLVAQTNTPVRSLMRATDAAQRMTADHAREAEGYTLGVQAVHWGMQWVKAGQTLRAMSSPALAARLGSQDVSTAGINVWTHHQSLLTYNDRLIETPNTETLYSSAVVDLQDGPVVIVHPDFADRYFRTSIWELHGDAHTISQRKDGGKPPPYVLVRIGWDGQLPEGMRVIQMRSRYVLAAPHIAVYGADDLPSVRAVQQGFKLIALKDWGTSNKALQHGQPMRPLHRPNTATPAELLFFEELCETLKDVTVRDDELAFVRQAERIGVTLANGFQFENLDAMTIAGLKRAVLDGQSIIEYQARALAAPQPGGTWMVCYDLTRLDDWLFRAAVGWKHVWGDLASEILFPIARADANGQPLTGKLKYTLRFAAGQLPPARYWRISMYNMDGFFIDNPIGRYGIGNMAESLALNRDGSLTIHVQSDSPGKARELNWLPAPEEGFFLMMRLYQPEEKMYRGEYILPPLEPHE
jgi:hypothetical protein